MMRRYTITIKAIVDELAIANDVSIEKAVANYLGAVLESFGEYCSVQSIKAKRSTK